MSRTRAVSEPLTSAAMIRRVSCQLGAAVAYTACWKRDSPMRTRIRLGIAGIAIVAAVFAAGYTVAAAVAPSFVPAGATRYAMVSKVDTATTSSTSFVSMSGMSTSLSVQSGKSADLIITFSGEVNSCFAMDVRAVVDGSPASPSSTQFFWQAGNTGADSRAFTFFSRNIGSGNHTVAIQWAGVTSCSQEFVAARSMVVTANIH